TSVDFPRRFDAGSFVSSLSRIVWCPFVVFPCCSSRLYHTIVNNARVDMKNPPAQAGGGYTDIQLGLRGGNHLQVLCAFVAFALGFIKNDRASRSDDRGELRGCVVASISAEISSRVHEPLGPSQVDHEGFGGVFRPVNARVGDFRIAGAEAGY